jgi:hypothetical protein
MPTSSSRTAARRSRSGLLHRCSALGEAFDRGALGPRSLASRPNAWPARRYAWCRRRTAPRPPYCSRESDLLSAPTTAGCLAPRHPDGFAVDDEARHFSPLEWRQNCSPQTTAELAFRTAHRNGKSEGCTHQNLGRSPKKSSGVGPSARAGARSRDPRATATFTLRYAIRSIRHRARCRLRAHQLARFGRGRTGRHCGNQPERSQALSSSLIGRA